MRKLLAALALCLGLTSADAQTISRNTAPSAAQESSRVFCTGACVLTGFQVNNWDTSNAVTVMVFDLAAAPVNGSVTPIKWYGIAAAVSSKQPAFVAASWDNPLSMRTGLVVVCSNTGPFTLTLVTTCTFSGDIR